MSWQNPPSFLNKLTASQQGGNRGAQIWGVDFKGTLYTIYQTTPGGQWSGWKGPDWNGTKRPKQVYELAACQRHDGTVQLWVLDTRRQLWSTWQNSPGGNWNGWQENWNPPPGRFRFKKIAASQLQHTSGQPARFWGITEDGILTSCAEVVPAGNWGGWSDWKKTPEDSRFIEVTACKQGDGKGAVWAIDNKKQLWGMGQVSAGGDWGGWSGPNWLSAPKVSNIAAVEIGGQKGACIWALTDDYKTIFNEQTKPGTDNWWGWVQGDFEDKMRAYEITAAGQNNGHQQLWVISLRQVLHSMQTAGSPPSWQRYWEPPPEK
jgi:hypothetical protein